jgi:hypothetical protein
VVVVHAGSPTRPLAQYSRDGRLTGAVGFSNAAAVFALKERFGDPVAEVLATLG